MFTRIDKRLMLVLPLALLAAGAWWMLSSRNQNAGELRQVYTFSFAGPGALNALTERGLEHFSWPELHLSQTASQPIPPPAAEWTSATLRIVGGPHTWSADGTWLAFQHGDDVEIWRTSGTHPTAVLAGAGRGLVRMDLSSDGSTLVTDQSDPALAVRRWQLDAGTLDASAPLPVEGALLALSPDGALAAAYTLEGITLINIHGDVAMRNLPLPAPTRVDTAIFSADGTLLAAAGATQPPEVWIWRVSDGALLHTLRGYDDTIAALAFSPDAALLAAGGGHNEPVARKDTSVRVWRLDNGSTSASGGALLPGQLPAATVEHIAFSPDGHTLATLTSDGTLRFWPAPFS